jgi:hypothetical protein
MLAAAISASAQGEDYDVTSGGGGGGKFGLTEMSKTKKKKQ